MRTVVLVGNFDVPWCSESHYAWTFENDLGWKVKRIQENRTGVAEILRACDDSEVKAFMWVHTHGWDFSGDRTAMTAEIESRGIKTFSYHLDKYWGIGNRQSDYLKHPSFHLNYFFSTDGGNEQKWKDAEINHVWILPGVVRYGTSLGTPNQPFVDVLFTGSEHYHGEYGFRPRLIQTLRDNYGGRFQIKQGVRETDLNNLYASSRVCVGDHIFSGCPRYSSDRLFETIGRGGFIIYPETEGITENIPGLVTYRAQDTQDLINKIDYYLDIGHEEERLERRNAAYEYVKKNGTYTNRLREILQIMGLE